MCVCEQERGYPHRLLEGNWAVFLYMITGSVQWKGLLYHLAPWCWQQMVLHSQGRWAELPSGLQAPSWSDPSPTSLTFLQHASSPFLSLLTSSYSYNSILWDGIDGGGSTRIKYFFLINLANWKKSYICASAFKTGVRIWFLSSSSFVIILPWGG